MAALSSACRGTRQTIVCGKDEHAAGQCAIGHLVGQTLHEGRLQLRHKRLQAHASLRNEQAECAQDGRLDFPCKAIPNDADERACVRCPC